MHILAIVQLYQRGQICVLPFENWDRAPFLLLIGLASRVMHDAVTSALNQINDYDEE